MSMSAATSVPDPLLTLDPNAPFGTYAEMRRDASVHWSKRFAAWAVVGHAEAATALDHKDFEVSDLARQLARFAERGGPDLTNVMIIHHCITELLDPKAVDRVRRIFGRILGNRYPLNLKQRLADKAAQLLEEGKRAGSLDLADGFSRPIAVHAFATLLGIPESEEARMLHGGGIVNCFARVAHSVRDLRRFEAAAAESIDYFEDMINRHRGTGSADGLGQLIESAETELGWSERQLAGFMVFLLGASRETTAPAIAGGAVELLRQRGIFDAVRDERKLLPEVTLELLRLVAPFQYVTRSVTAPQMLGGQQLGVGDAVCVFIGAANRDPEIFEAPDQVKLGRGKDRQLTFAPGPFRCLGPQLATLEVTVAMDALMAYPELRLVEAEVRWGPRLHVREALRAMVSFG